MYSCSGEWLPGQNPGSFQTDADLEVVLSDVPGLDPHLTADSVRQGFDSRTVLFSVANGSRLPDGSWVDRTNRCRSTSRVSPQRVSPQLTTLDNSASALNFTTFLAGILSSLPVCGLRPVRAERLLILNEPNRPQVAWPSVCRAFVVPSINPSRAFFASAFDNPDSDAIHTAGQNDTTIARRESAVSSCESQRLVSESVLTSVRQYQSSTAGAVVASGAASGSYSAMSTTPATTTSPAASQNPPK